MKHFKKQTKRIAAMLLALAMIVASVPQHALEAQAAEADVTHETEVLDGNGNIEAEIAAEDETEVKAAEETQNETETEPVKETQQATETESAKETQNETETETVTETKTETAEVSETETENSSETAAEDEESRVSDELKTDQTAETMRVTVQIPYRELLIRGENLLESFEYAICGSGTQADIKYISYTPDVSFDDMLKKDKKITFDVPIGSVLYVKPAFKYKCEIEYVKYRGESSSAQTNADAAGDEAYKISEITGNIDIEIKAYRLFDVVFKAEGAKIYRTLDDIDKNKELTELTVSEKKEETFYAVPDDGKVLKSAASNSEGIYVSRERRLENQPAEYRILIPMKGVRSFKDKTTIFVTAGELDKYKAAFDWPAADADVFYNNGSDEHAALSAKEISITEGDFLSFYVKPKDSQKCALVEYTDEARRKTVVLENVYDEESGEYSFNIADIRGNISVKISVVDIFNITLKAANKYVSDGYYGYSQNVEEGGYNEFQFPAADASSNAERESETKIKLPAGCELRLFVPNGSAYGTTTASASVENTEITRQMVDGVSRFYLTPAADTTVTFDVEPAKFIVDADAGVDFSLCRKDSTGALTDIALSDGNSMDYYESSGGNKESGPAIFLKIKKEQGKRYAVSGEYSDFSEYRDPTIWDIEETSSITGEERYAFYGFDIGYCKKVFIKSYDVVKLNFESEGADDKLRINKFYIWKEEGYCWWTHAPIESDNTITADKNKECFIGITYSFDSYKLESFKAGDNNLEFYEDYDDYDEWKIYKLVPAADTTISIKLSPLKHYTVTVKKSDGVASYAASYLPQDGEGTPVEDAEKVFQDIAEDSIFSIEDIVLEDNTYVRKVECEADGGTRQLINTSYLDGYWLAHHVKITGDTTIYLDAVPSREFTLKFDNTDGFRVKIWESGNEESFNNPLSLTNGKITLRNDKDYLFDFVPEDGYIVESVTQTDAGGKETLVKRRETGGETITEEGYRIGTGYGNTENLNIKVKLKDAYRLRFETPADFETGIYALEDRYEAYWINDKATAVPAADSYSFRIPGYNEQLYKMTLKERDSFTLTKEYRTSRGDGYDYRYAVYTVARNKDAAPQAATATVVIEKNATYAVTLPDEIPLQIKSIGVSYYRFDGDEGYQCYNYKATGNKVNVANTVDNVVRINPMSGYTPKVILKGASGESVLEPVRNDGGYLEYAIGKLTEDKSITVTAERTAASTLYYVGFATRSAAIMEPDHKLPYSCGYDVDYDGGYISYLVASGESISFIVEPDYGYKVESVFFKYTTIRDRVIKPDQNGVYTAKPMHDNTVIVVKTVKSDAPDKPDTPDKPDKPDNKAKVTFTYPANVNVTVNGVSPENNTLDVEKGKQISFKAAVTDESYEIKSVTADGAAIPYDAAAGTYTITITADTAITITSAKKQEEPKPGEPKPEEPKPGEPKPGEPKPEEPKPEEPKPEEPKPEEPKPDKPNTEGLKVVFDGFKENETPGYTYTGSAVMPQITVTYNGEALEEGTDYTVQYANNVNVSTDAKPAKLTLAGKGSLSGKHEYDFKITKKSIGDDDVTAGSVKVVSSAKAVPVLVYNGIVLSQKDFDNPEANKKFSASGTIELTGKGNFDGKRTINVEVVEKTALNKISITLDNAKNKELAYDGVEKYPVFAVFDADKQNITDKKDTAYIVAYPDDIISAGTVKFTVVGIGDYTGTVTKSYKIKPSAKASEDINVSGPLKDGYAFASTGVTAYDPDVTLGSTMLVKGKDYTLAYSNNKKAGTAKCKINFIGNYKGIKAITKDFTINKSDIKDFKEGNIIVADKLSGGKEGIYKSVPYIIDNEADVLVKSSEFKFTYYTDEAQKTEMKGSNKLSSGTVWIKIEPKNAKGNYTGEKTVTYTVREKGDNLSKAQITFDSDKVPYTGSPLTPGCKVNGKSIKDDPKYIVRYLNNVNKGKAAVIITGAKDSGIAESRTAAFTITASAIAP